MVLAVFGCVVFTFILLWAVVPLVLGPLFAVTAIQRAKVLSDLDGLGATGPRPVRALGCLPK